MQRKKILKENSQCSNVPHCSCGVSLEIYYVVTVCKILSNFSMKVKTTNPKQPDNVISCRRVSLGVTNTITTAMQGKEGLISAYSFILQFTTEGNPSRDAGRARA